MARKINYWRVDGMPLLYRTARDGGHRDRDHERWDRGAGVSRDDWYREDLDGSAEYSTITAEQAAQISLDAITTPPSSHLVLRFDLVLEAAGWAVGEIGLT